jgi:hypothetical protein
MKQSQGPSSEFAALAVLSEVKVALLFLLPPPLLLNVLLGPSPALSLEYPGPKANTCTVYATVGISLPSKNSWPTRVFIAPLVFN